LSALDGDEYSNPDCIAKCQTPGCKETKTFPPSAIRPGQWWCPTCDAENLRKARAANSAINNQRRAEERRDSVKDDYGRIKDGSRTIFGEDGPYNS